MTIKIITMIGDNYGSALQAYALQNIIKNLGGADKYNILTTQKLFFEVS